MMADNDKDCGDVAQVPFLIKGWTSQQWRKDWLPPKVFLYVIDFRLTPDHFKMHVFITIIQAPQETRSGDSPKCFS